MPIEATGSTQGVVSTTTASNSVSSNSNKASDSSFKDEMTKVSETDKKDSEKVTEKNVKTESSSNTQKDSLSISKEENTFDKKDLGSKKGNNNNIDLQSENNNLVMPAFVLNQMSFSDASVMLSNDIAQVIGTNKAFFDESWTMNFGQGGALNLTMNETDAQFFIDLASGSDDINFQTIAVQSQNMLNGSEAAAVESSAKVSQALLIALSEAQKNNQPIRIDFEQNISVILRVGKDGAISANFIPGDKAVEQYLRNNIETLRNSFDEQNLKYSELSYSNASKEQNRRRREEKRQQGE